MLSEEELTNLKAQIITQIESNFPEEQKADAIQQIEEMGVEQFEAFLKRNNLIKDENSNEEGSSEKNCVFCSIAEGKINSCKIGENEGAIAVLEINPISKGHSMIVQKVHSSESQKEAKALAKEITSLLEKKLMPLKIEESETKLFGHNVINILPVYEDETFSSKRSPASMEELEKIKEELEKQEIKEEEKTKESLVEEIKEILKIKKRIP